MPPAKTSISSGLLLFALGALSGAFAATLLPNHEPTSVGTTLPALAPQHDSVLLDDALAALRHARLELERAASQVSTATIAEHRSSARSADTILDADELSASLEELKRAVEVLRSVSGTRAAASLRHPSIEDQGEPIALQPMRHAHLNMQDSKLYYGAQTEFRSRHLLWSYQDVLNAYGRPQGVKAGQWEYSLPAPNGGTDHLYFTFNDGLVFDAIYRYRNAD